MSDTNKQLETLSVDMKKSFETVGQAFADQDEVNKKVNDHLSKLESHIPADLKEQQEKATKAAGEALQAVKDMEKELAARKTSTPGESKFTDEEYKSFAEDYHSSTGEHLTRAQFDAFSDAYKYVCISKKGKEYMEKAGLVTPVVKEMIEKTLTGLNAAGGDAVVAPEFAKELEHTDMTVNPMMQHAKVLTGTIDKTQRILATRDDTVQWIDESGSFTSSGGDTSFRAENYTAYTVIKEAKLSDAFMDDASFSFSDFLVRPVVEAISIEKAIAFVEGNGSTRPRGIFDYATQTSTTSGDGRTGEKAVIDDTATGGADQRTDAQRSTHFRAILGGSASTITYDSLATAQASLRQLGMQYHMGAKYFMNATTLASFRNLKDVDGAPLLMNEFDMDGLRMMLRGREVVILENAPDVGANAYPIFYGNMMDAYTIYNRRGIRLIKINTDYPTWTYRFAARCGGGAFNRDAGVFIKVATA